MSSLEHLRDRIKAMTNEEFESCRESLRKFLAASEAEQDTIMSAVRIIIIKTASTIVRLKIQKGAAVLRQLNISEFHAASLDQLGQLYLRLRATYPDISAKRTLELMDEADIFDSYAAVTALPVREIRNAIPSHLLRELHEATEQHHQSTHGDN